MRTAIEPLVVHVDIDDPSLNTDIDQITPADAEVLARLATGRELVFDVGSYVGGSALTMLEAGVDHVICIDACIGLPNILTPRPRSFFTDLLVRRLEKYKDQVSIWVALSSIGVVVRSEMADLVFIDADHHYESVKEDIETWYPVVKKGGILCGHDFDAYLEDCDPALMEKYTKTFPTEDGATAYYDYGPPNNRHYGVIKAVTEAFGRPSVDETIWWVEKP